MGVISSPFPDRVIIIKSYTLNPGTSIEIYFGNFMINAVNIAIGETIRRKIKLDFVVFLESSAELGIFVSNDGGNTEYHIFSTFKRRPTSGVCIPVPKIPLHTLDYSYYRIILLNPTGFILYPEIMFVFEILEEEPTEEEYD